MKEDLNKVLNYMKQYVENKYEHDSEPMLNYKDLQLILEEIDRLNNIINELEKWLKEHSIIDYNCKETTIHEQLALNTAYEYLTELKEDII